MSENLKPCPVCGGMAVVQSPYKQAIHMEFYVRCMRCGLRTEVSTIEEIPVSEWNNRMKEEILRERAEKAEADRDALTAKIEAMRKQMSKEFSDEIERTLEAEDRARAAETRIGTLQALDISAQEIIRKLRVQVEQLRFDLLSLEHENKKICKALSDLYDACMQADGEGELHYTIDGDLLDAARIALVGKDSNVTEE